MHSLAEWFCEGRVSSFATIASASSGDNRVANLDRFYFALRNKIKQRISKSASFEETLSLLSFLEYLAYISFVAYSNMLSS